MYELYFIRYKSAHGSQKIKPERIKKADLERELYSGAAASSHLFSQTLKTFLL